MDRNRDDEIRKRALQIWEDEGRPDGKDVEHWARAERQLDSGGQRGGTPDPTGFADGSKSERTAEDLKSGRK